MESMRQVYLPLIRKQAGREIGAPLCIKGVLLYICIIK